MAFCLRWCSPQNAASHLPTCSCYMVARYAYPCTSTASSCFHPSLSPTSFTMVRAKFEDGAQQLAREGRMPLARLASPLMRRCGCHCVSAGLMRRNQPGTGIR